MCFRKIWILVAPVLIFTADASEVEEQAIEMMELIPDTFVKCCRNEKKKSNITLLDVTLNCLENVILVLEKQISEDSNNSITTHDRERRSLQPNDTETSTSKEKKTDDIQGSASRNTTHLREDDLTIEGRGRKRKNMMMSLMMFAMVAVGMIMVPMGFQFLAVLGGKALLLSKMALLLTSIQGLKKIATSNVNYGLYSTAPSDSWHYDRQWPNNNYDSYASPPNYEYYNMPEQHYPHYDIPHHIRRSPIAD